jgi:hypothetical protein
MALYLSTIANPASAQSDCADVRGTESIITGHRIIMVGEVHGTKEMPAMFTRLVCAALRRGNGRNRRRVFRAHRHRLYQRIVAGDPGRSITQGVGTRG